MLILSVSIFQTMADVFDHWRDQFGTRNGEFEFEIDWKRSGFRSPNGHPYTALETREFSSMKQFSFSELLRSEWPKHRESKDSLGEIDPPLDFPPFPERSPEFTCTNQHHNHSVPKQHELDILLGKLNRNFGMYHGGSAAGPLAFYRPFHFDKHWGMFFLVDRLADLAKLRAHNIKNNQQYGHYFTDEIIEDMVFWKTFYHEVYHHKIEMFATKLEFALREKVYCKYFHKFYCRTKGLDYCLEEAFANVYGALKCAERMKGQIPKAITIQVLREHFLSRAPNGYKLAYSILELSQQKIKLLEQEFLEILSSYAFDEVQEEHRCGRRSDPIHPELYELFTYSLDPKINTDNEVTFLIPS